MGTSGHAAKASTATGPCGAISSQNARSHRALGTRSLDESEPSSDQGTTGVAPQPAGVSRLGSTFGNSAASCAGVNTDTLSSDLNCAWRISAPSVGDAVRLGCRNLPRSVGTSATMFSDPLYMPWCPNAAGAPLAVGTGTPDRSRTVATSRG